MLESFTYLDWSSLLIHLSGIISYISLETQLLQDVKGVRNNIGFFS